MTQLKTGDRVVPGRFESTTYIDWNSAMEQFIGKEYAIKHINEGGLYVLDLLVDNHFWFWPERALTPVKPKWEPVVGDEIITTRLNRKDKIKSIKTIYHTENQDGYFELHEIEKYEPTPEDEVGSILCKLIGGDNYILRDAKADIMALFNRNKEGEGR